MKNLLNLIQLKYEKNNLNNNKKPFKKKIKNNIS